MQSLNKLADSLSNEQYLSSDSKHLFMFNLINLIGVNFVQIVTKTNLEFRKKNQQNLNFSALNARNINHKLVRFIFIGFVTYHKSVNIYTNLFLIFLDRYVIKDLIDNKQLSLD